MQHPHPELDPWEELDPDEIPGAIPESDSPEVEKAWEAADPMEGPSPTG